MPAQLLHFAESVLRRPGMYTALGTPAEVIAFLEGFVSGRAGAKGPVEDWNAFTEWLAAEIDVDQTRVFRSILDVHGNSATEELLRRVLEYRAIAESRMVPGDAPTVAREEHPSPSVKAPPSIPGSQWRVLARGPNDVPIRIPTQGCFDELVVDHWLHIEQMDAFTWWVRLGDARLTTLIDSNGRVTVDILRGFYEDIRGTTGDWNCPA